MNMSAGIPDRLKNSLNTTASDRVNLNDAYPEGQKLKIYRQVSPVLTNPVEAFKITQI